MLVLHSTAAAHNNDWIETASQKKNDLYSSHLSCVFLYFLTFFIMTTLVLL